MDTVKVSVIIPAYNAERTVRKAIASALSQSLHSIEVIVVDDGSVDNTKSVCLEFLEDKRFQYYYNTNSGVSSARNFGISIAKGEYIAFLDADDTMEIEMLKKMYGACEKSNADICICDVNRIENSGVVVKRTDAISGGEFDKDMINSDILTRMLGYVNEKGSISTFDWVVWRRIFRRSMIESNHIQFNEEFSNGEDLLFSFLTTIYADKIVYLKDHYLYNYYYCSDSITNSYATDFWTKRCRICEIIYQAAEDRMIQLDPCMMSLFTMRCIKTGYANIAFGFQKNSGIKSYLEYKAIVKDDYVREAVKNLPVIKFDFEWNRIIQWTKKKKSFTLYSYYKDTYGHSRFYHRLRKITKRISR